jgi:hypothetical protein
MDDAVLQVASQVKLQASWPNRRGANTAAYNTRTSNDNNIDNTSVDINGNGYSRPNSRSVTSPGIRPIPIFLSHGQQDDSTATATKVVKSQRIIAISQPEAK